MLTKKQIATRIKAIAKTNESLNQRIHVVLTHIAAYGYMDGNVGFAALLLDSVKGKDKKALIRYLQENCFTRVKADGTVSLNKKARREADFEDGEAVIAHLDDLPRWDDSSMTTEQAVKALDVAARIKALTKQVQKAKEEGREVTGRDEMMEAFASLEVAMMGLSHVQGSEAAH